MLQLTTYQPVNKNHHPEQEKMSYDKSVPQPRRGGYQRVAQDEQDDSSTQSSDVNMTDRRRRNQKRLGREAKKKELMESIQTKIWAVLWTAAMIAVIYFSDFFMVLLSSDRVNRTWFNLSCLCWGVDFSCLLYLMHLPYRGIDLEWNVYCPRVIPLATGAIVAGSFSLLMATWPVWGFMTPFILGIIGVGMLMSMHFVPACNCCS